MTKRMTFDLVDIICQTCMSCMPLTESYLIISSHCDKSLIQKFKSKINKLYFI